MSGIRLLVGLLLVVAASVLGACSAAVTSPSPSPSPSDPPDAQGVIVTIRVADEETFKVLLTDPADIEIARKLLAGEEAPTIPNGRIVYGDPGVNEGYSWHLDPNDFEWADVTVEVCDGRPSDVEDREITSDRYCTWAGKVIAVEPAA